MMDLQQLSNQLNDEFRKIDTRFVALEKNVGDLGNKLDARFNTVDRELAAINSRCDKLDNRIDKLDTRIDKLEHGFDVRVTRVEKGIDDRLIRIERELTALNHASPSRQSSRSLGVRGSSDSASQRFSQAPTERVDEIEIDA